MKNCTYIEAMKIAARGYFDKVDEIEVRKKAACEMYRGEYLKEQLKKLDDEQGKASCDATNKMMAYNQEKARFYELEKDKQLSGNLPDDIKLLSAPVKLTEEEVKTLATRHADNYIMQRAIKDYGEKNNIYIEIALTPDEKIKTAKEAYDRFREYICPKNKYAEVESRAYFDLDTGFEGSYAQYDKILG